MLEQPGHVVGQPEAVERLTVEGQDDYGTARHAAQFAEALRRIGPLMDGDHGHGGVDRVVVEGQRLGHGVDRGSQMDGTLRSHRR